MRNRVKHYLIVPLPFLIPLCVAIVASSLHAAAQENDDSDTWRPSSVERARIRRGFELAPVPLNLEGRNRALVGLGSYLVNHGGCNDCHDTGPQNQYVPGGNPYFGQPKQVNPATYLGGGRDFGPLVEGSAHIISRNLTPGKSGLPEGDHTFEDFLQILRTGIDFDHLHPTCPGEPDETCIPRPFDGDLLQIMPWPNFQELTDHDIRAIYEYLSAIPCIQGNDPGDPPDRCP
jgi:hypothetical protein